MFQWSILEKKSRFEEEKKFYSVLFENKMDAYDHFLKPVEEMPSGEIKFLKKFHLQKVKTKVPKYNFRILRYLVNLTFFFLNQSLVHF